MGPVRLGTLLFILTVYGAWAGTPKEEDDDTERLPSKCEVCLALLCRPLLFLGPTGTGKTVVEETQWSLCFPSSHRETRLEEALENLCERILDYSVHAERKGSLRYAKGQSQTMATLKGLVQKGVKVDLGIPLELWDEPSVEVTFLKKQCETMLEEFEDVVGDWYFHHQEQPLQHFLCEGHVLPASETACLQETWTGKEKITDGQEKTEEEDQEEEEEEVTNTLVHSQRDPEDL
uniref:DUF3456 domain-containing protein n=1 Tax=Capra hircus TaxID=9925 RepID=A0A8C2Y1V3_CAPHI